MTVYERIIIEIKEMKGYDISDIDIRNYTEDRIRQQYERILTERNRKQKNTKKNLKKMIIKFLTGKEKN